MNKTTPRTTPRTTPQPSTPTPMQPLRTEELRHVAGGPAGSPTM